MNGQLDPMSTESQSAGPDMASDESQRLFADELKALIADTGEEALEVTQNEDGQEEAAETTQVNGQTSSENQQPEDLTSQPEYDQELEEGKEEEPTYVTKKSNDQQQEEAQEEAQPAEKPTVHQQEPDSSSSPSRKRPSPAEEEGEPESPPKPAKREAKQCGVCQVQPGKYRCPRCPIM